MEIEPRILLKLLLLCVCLGAVVGSFCDIFRVFFSFFKKKGVKWGVARFFCDLTAVLTATLGVIALCYYFNNGTLRGFCFIGVAIGFFAYRYTLSFPFRLLLKLIFRMLFIILRIILLPFAKIFTFSVKILNKTKFYLAKVLEKVLLMVYNIINYNYILKRSKKGFLDV